MRRVISRTAICRAFNRREEMSFKVIKKEVKQDEK